MNKIVFKIYDLVYKIVLEVMVKEIEVKFYVEERKYLEIELIGDIDRWLFYFNMLIVLSKFIC